MNLVCVDGGLQAFQPLYVIASDKDIYMLADIALFVEHAVAERTVPQPKGIENIPDGREIAVESDLGLAVGKRFEISAEMNNNRHIFSNH